MSLIEGDSFYPSLFNTSEIPIDFAVPSTSLTDSPGFRQLKKFSSNDLSAPQTVPGTSPQTVPDEPLFQLFMSGGIDKLEFPLNATLLKGLQMTDDMLFQSGLIHKSLANASGEHSGMDIKFPPGGASDAGVVPDFTVPKANIGSDEPSKNANKKRKFIQNPAAGKADVSSVSMSSVEQPLTPEDERNMKRQRRLVKNREAAQLFRQRQKAYIQDLEKRVGDLTASNNEFRARVELLNSENKLIKEQLIYLRNFITQSPNSPNGAGPTMSPGGSPNSMPMINLPPGLSLPPGLFGMNVPNMAMLSGMGQFGNLPMPNNFPMGMAPIPPPNGMPNIGNMNSQGNIIPTSEAPMISAMNSPNVPSSPISDSDDKAKIKLIK